jgi:hypothetical protein
LFLSHGIEFRKNDFPNRGERQYNLAEQWRASGEATDYPERAFERVRGIEVRPMTFDPMVLHNKLTVV